MIIYLVEGQFEDVHKVRIILQELEKNSYREAYIKNGADKRQIEKNLIFFTLHSILLITDGYQCKKHACNN